MAITKTVTQILNVASIAANTESAQGTALALTNEALLALAVRLTFHASATVGAELRVYSSPSGTNYDTIPYHTEGITLTAGATVQKTIALTPAPANIKVSVKNLDTAQAITNATVDATQQKVA